MERYWNLNELTGKKILAAYINEDKTSIKLKCEGEFIEIYMDADCCSETWIEHSTNVEALNGGYSIKSIKTIEYGEVMPTRQEYDQLYGLEIETTHKYGYKFMIEFRNSSNGYYGGNAEFRKCSDDLSGYSPLTEDF